MTKPCKYTKSILEPIVAKSISIRQVLNLLGVKVYSGGMHAHISKRVKQLGISTAHFLGSKANQGSNHKGGNKKRTADEVLVSNASGSREKVKALRWAMLDKKVPYHCAVCGLLPWWNGRELVLEIDHVDNNPLNNTVDNLRFLCSNCHTQITKETMKVRRVAESQTRTA